MPQDQIVQLCPGSDLPARPVQTLLSINDLPGGQASVQAGVGDAITPGSMVIIAGSEDIKIKGGTLPMLVGSVMDLHKPPTTRSEAQVLVSWWIPSFSEAMTMKQGRKKQILDLENYPEKHGITGQKKVTQTVQQVGRYPKPRQRK